MQLLKYKFLSLLIISSLTTAVPAPFSPHTSFYTPPSHIYCQNMGCEFCVEIGMEPNVYYACDGFPANRAASASNSGNISTIDLREAVS